MSARSWSGSLATGTGALIRNTAGGIALVVATCAGPVTEPLPDPAFPGDTGRSGASHSASRTMVSRMSFDQLDPIGVLLGLLVVLAYRRMRHR